MIRSVGIWSLIFVTTLILLTTGCARKIPPESTTQMGASGPSAEEIGLAKKKNAVGELPKASWGCGRRCLRQGRW